MVVKLLNGYFLAAWTQGGFKPKTVSDRDGLLFSLTNRRAFEPAKPNARVVAYDDFFIIFGNSELRLKTQDNKVFSNFGVNNGYFNSRGEKVDCLLGSGTNREVEFEAYEFFQLKFK